MTTTYGQISNSTVAGLITALNALAPTGVTSIVYAKGRGYTAFYYVTS
jgi:hypothetical protein